MRNFLIITLLIFVGGAITFCAIYLTPLKWVNVIEPKISDIDPHTFYQLYAENPEEYVFIDVRSKDAYDRVHALGAELMPLHTLYDEKENLPKNEKKIVLICSGGRASGVGYSYLEHYGFRNLHRIEGGIEAWQAAGLPIQSNI